MIFQKLKIIISYNSFKDFSLFESLFSLNFFFKKNLNQIFFFTNIKKKTKKIIILRSPFVNKKSRTQVGFLFYKGNISLNFNFKILNFNFKNYLYKIITNKINSNKIFFKFTIITLGFLF